MRKAIQLNVTLWIEGEDDPAHDFAASTMEAVREVIGSGAPSHPELRFIIKTVSEDDESDDDDAGSLH